MRVLATPAARPLPLPAGRHRAGALPLPCAAAAGSNADPPSLCTRPTLMQNALQSAGGGDSAALVLGACGFSTGRVDEWPGVNTVALPPSLVLGMDLPQAGCGACFEVQCGSGGDNSSGFSQVGRWGCGGSPLHMG